MNYTQTISGPMAPTAHICVNKSRLKVYNNAGELPTYYLNKGQEFQFEIFNPTTNVILAKISLNGQTLSQGGLIINPGQRVYLDRYLDVAKKFLFDTYEVDNTSEVAVAIVKNGDFKVEFYRENTNPPNYSNLLNTRTIWSGPTYTQTIGGCFTTTNNPTGLCTTTISNGINMTNVSYNNTSFTNGTNVNSCYSAGILNTSHTPTPILRGISKLKKSKETGRVEKGSNSNQIIQTVDKDFSSYAFHTIEYKMLPVSQKINTLEDINIKRYCTNCGAKLGKTDRFCASCGTKG